MRTLVTTLAALGLFILIKSQTIITYNVLYPMSGWAVLAVFTANVAIAHQLSLRFSVSNGPDLQSAALQWCVAGAVAAILAVVEYDLLFIATVGLEGIIEFTGRFARTFAPLSFGTVAISASFAYAFVQDS